MEIFKLIHVIFELYESSIRTRQFLSDADAELKQHDVEEANNLRHTYRRIIRIVIVTLILGLGIPFVIPCITYFSTNSVEDSGFRLLIGMIAGVTASIIIYVYAGVALGCLLASSDFLLGPVGTRWMQLIGTDSIRVARIACIIMVIFGYGVMIGLAVLMFRMKLPT